MQACTGSHIFGAPLALMPHTRRAVRAAGGKDKLIILADSEQAEVLYDLAVELRDRLRFRCAVVVAMGVSASWAVPLPQWYLLHFTGGCHAVGIGSLEAGTTYGHVRLSYQPSQLAAYRICLAACVE